MYDFFWGRRPLIEDPRFLYLNLSAVTHRNYRSDSIYQVKSTLCRHPQGVAAAERRTAATIIIEKRPLRQMDEFVR